LGPGTFVFGFRVKRWGINTNNFWHSIFVFQDALSLSITYLDSTMKYVRMRQAYDSCPNIVMGIEEGGFQRLLDKDNNEVGAALVRSHVGRGCSDLCRSALSNLSKISNLTTFCTVMHVCPTSSASMENPVWIDSFESTVASLPIFFA
jgi:hypothetical protein